MIKNMASVFSFVLLLVFGFFSHVYSAKADVGFFLNPGQQLSMAESMFLGEYAYDSAASIVTFAGDVDGDGLSELLIGANGSDLSFSDAGATYLFFGSSLAAGITSLALADYIFVGEATNDYSGQDIVSAGDVDGDGLGDILIGAAWNATRKGKVYLFLGSSLSGGGTLSLAAADYIITGETTGDDFGYSMSSGDIDGDGLTDIIVGSGNHSTASGLYSGRVYVFLGKSLVSGTVSASSADYIIDGENARDYAGYSVSTAGDCDGDGLSDILVGAYGNEDSAYRAGKTYLILASTLLAGGVTNLSAANYMFIGENYNDFSGFNVASAGDLDGDGLGDVLIGAKYNSDAEQRSGAVYVVLGKSLVLGIRSLISADYKILGVGAHSHFGLKVAPAGDVNGDGLSDFLVGSELFSINTGKTYLFLGGSLSGHTMYADQADYIFDGETSTDRSGTAFAGGGDVNGDGNSDMIFGAHANSDTALQAGKAFLVLGIENCSMIANAGADQVVNDATIVTLDATASSSTCFSAATYEWTQTAGPAMTLSDTTLLSPVFVSGADGDVYTFTLTVSVSGHTPVTDEVIITVDHNTPPVANKVSYTTFSRTIFLSPSVIDADGDAIVQYFYTLSTKPSASMATISPSGTTNSPSTILIMDLPGNYVVSYRAFDGRDWSNTEQMIVKKYTLRP